VYVATAVGERLDLVNVSRRCAGVYECTANNDIPPPVHHRVTLTVECTQKYAVAVVHCTTYTAGGASKTIRYDTRCYFNVCSKADMTA